MSFRLKTIVGIALIEAVLLLIIIWNSLNFLKVSNQEALIARASTTATLFATMTKDAILATDLASLDSFITEILKNPDILYAKIVSTTDGVLSEGGDPRLLIQEFAIDTSFNVIDDGIFNTRVDIAERGISYGYVEIGLSIEQIQHVLGKARRRVFSLAAIEMVLTALFSFVLGHVLTRQLDDLSKATTRIASGELGYQIPVRGRDELAQTASMFNKMSNELKKIYNELHVALSESERRGQEIQENESRMRAVLEGVVDGIITVNQNGEIESLNPAAEQIFGYNAEEVIGDNINLMIPEPYNSRHDGFIQTYLQTGIATVIGIGRECVGVRKNANTFPIDLAISEVKLQDTRLFIGIVRDISERKRIEEEIKKLNEELEGRVAARTAELVRTNAELVAEVNERKQAEEALKYQNELEVLITKISKHFINLDVNELDDGINYALRTIGRFAEVDRSYVYFLSEDRMTMSYTHEWCAEGIPPGIDNFQGMSVAEFPWMMGQLEHAEPVYIPRVTELPSEAEFEKQIMQAQDIQSLIALPMFYGGNLVGFIGFESVRREKLWDDNTSYLLRVVADILVDALERQRSQRALLKAHDELELRVEQRTRELSQTNERLQQEITEREHIERELQQAKEAAEAASHAKSAFLANMSHELRTPLNAILGYAQILKGTDGLPEQQIKGLETIKRSGNHLLHLINDILDLSKIEAGHVELYSNDFHFPHFLRDLTDMMQIRAVDKELSFISDVAPDLPRWVHADEKRLRQVLVNLLGNAIKFTENGEVIFHVTRLNPRHLQRTHSPSHIVFRVEDTGIGIVPEKFKEIFLPFQQAGEDLFAIEGTGLGLAISRQLVSMMGGELQVNSTIGKGSTFWFEIPLAETSDVTAIKYADTSPVVGYTGERRTVLVVDDNSENRAMLVNMILPLGFEIIEAENGRECLKKAANSLPDAILLDLRMPIMGGIEVARRIRQQEFLQHMVIIAVSASVGKETQQESLDAGCNDFLVKPIKLEDLLELLQQHLDLEWEYAADSGKHERPPSESDQQNVQIVPFPEDVATRLVELARRGSTKRILTALEDIEQSLPECLPTVKRVRHLVKQYQFKHIIHLLSREGGKRS